MIIKTSKSFNESLYSLVGAILCISVLIWLRFPATQNGGFHNEDAAGIVYSARLLLAGGLPLVDTLELKAPGSFFLVAGVLKVFGDSLVSVQSFAVFWSGLAALGIFVGGRLMFGSSAGWVSTLLYILLAPITDSIDINYGAWMITPFIWANVLCLKWMQNHRLRYLVWTGVLVTCTALLKRQGAVLVPFFTAILVLHNHHIEGDQRRLFLRHFTLFGSGIGLGFMPILSFYAVHGEGMTFIQEYFFSSGGWRYLDTLSWSEKISRLYDGCLGFWEYGALPTSLALGSILCAAVKRTSRPKFIWLLLGLFVVSCVGLTLGFRFFKGYYLQVLPVLVWIAVAPWGVASLFAGRRKRVQVIISVLCIGVFWSAGGHDLKGLRRIRDMRKSPRDLGAQRIAKLIQKESEVNDQIWVWGRAAWPVYIHAERFSANRYFKTLAVFTTNLTNTWRRGTRPIEFEPKSRWKPLIEALEENKPSFIVLAHNERYGKFKALIGLLKRSYVPRKLTVRGFSLYARRTADGAAP